MIRNKFAYSLIILIILPLKVLTGQTTDELEIKLLQLQNSYDHQYRALDSAKQILHKKAAQIDSEKKKQNPDRNSIIDLMSHSVTISNQIDSQQKKVTKLESEIESIKKILYKRYSHSIDSLNQVKNSRRYGISQDGIQKEIILLTEKKLILAPKVSGFSLNPERILKMDLKNSKNEREEMLHREYLKNAINELDSQLKQVNESYREAEEIVYLQKKAGRFLDEAEFQSEIRPGRSRNVAGGERAISDAYNGAGPAKDASWYSNISSYTGLLIQLQAVTSPNVKPLWLKTGSSRDKHLSMSEYYELLKEVRKNLSEYRDILVHKLGGK